jgi:hypothetical protein
MSGIDSFITEKHKYIRPDNEEVSALRTEFLNACCATEALRDEEERLNIGADGDVAIKIVERVRQRKLYFYVYHDIKDINGIDELKETALYTFWMLKLQPFYWKDGYVGKDYKSNYELNAKVALDFFLRGIKLYADEKTARSKESGQPIVYVVSFERGDPNILKSLYYSFRFRDWSKESLMDLAESSIIGFNPTPSPAKSAIKGYTNR